MNPAASCQPMPRGLPPLPLLLCLSLLLLLGSCAGRQPAPIVDHSEPGSLREDERYVVLRGDTMFSIAFRFGLDYHRLAAANDIAVPYTIYPGQVLRLAEVEPPVVPATVQPQAAAATPAPKRTASTPPPAPVAQRPVVKPAPAASSSGSVVTKSTPARAPAAGDWRWPASGRITRRFESDLHKGLDISGDRGDPVQAAAAGTVVYAGSGIAGYGLMLIIRHSDEYLSAYGHNDALLVDEGAVVRAGQQVARLGSSGTDTVKLHFEIRRRGRPVDPLRLLPRR